MLSPSVCLSLCLACLPCLAALQVRIVLCMVVALILASVYAGQTQDTAADLIGFVGVIFLSTMFIGAINTNAIIQGACVPEGIWRHLCPLRLCVMLRGVLMATPCRLSTRRASQRAVA